MTAEEENYFLNIFYWFLSGYCIRIKLASIMHFQPRDTIAQEQAHLKFNQSAFKY
jgi:hypothetical protein